MGGGTDRGRVDFGRDEECDSIGAELVEEGREEIHGLEADEVNFGVVVVVEAWDDEEDEIHEEAKLLHVLTAVELVVDEEG